jgi:hypothetical protein
LSRKRTSLFLIADEKIIHLSEFPSSGDTAYAGIAVRNDSLYISYYSSPINHDLPWLIGMLFTTGIYLGRLDQNKLSNFIELKGVG